MANSIALYLRKGFSNKIFHFVVTRYFVYIIQFINSLLIAKILGPYYLGIWGFINLVIQYFGQFNMGIPHALNAMIAVRKNDVDYVTKVFNNTVFLTAILGGLILIVYFLFTSTNWVIGRQYNFGAYALAVCMIAILNNFISIFSNLFRVFGHFREISFSQAIFPVLVFLALFLVKEEQLIPTLVGCNIVAFIISIFIFTLASPIRLSFRFDKGILAIIQKRAISLFLYNTSFYLILISTRSFISNKYSVEEFGLFTFSFTIANAILLLFDSISFLLFPKLLNQLANSGDSNSLKVLNKIRNPYIFITNLIVHLSIFLYPFFLYFLPNYYGTEVCFSIIALTLALYSNSFGFNAILIAKHKEKKIAKIAIFSLAINLLGAFVATMWFNTPFSFVFLSTTFSYTLFLFLIVETGLSLVGGKINLKDLFRYAMPLNIALPIIMSFSLLIFHGNVVLYMLPLLFFIFLNWKSFFTVASTFKSIVKNENILNI